MNRYAYYDMQTGVINCIMEVDGVMNEPTAPNASIGVIPIPDNSCDDTTHFVDVSKSPHTLVPVSSSSNPVNASVALNIQS